MVSLKVGTFFETQCLLYMGDERKMISPSWRRSSRWIYEC